MQVETPPGQRHWRASQPWVQTRRFSENGLVIHGSIEWPPACGPSSPMSCYQKSVGRDFARALFASAWWEGMPSHQVARMQLFTRELCMPFGLFHRALEDALGRSVWIHELGLNLDGVIHEFLGESDAPTWEEIVNLIPREKRSGPGIVEC
jgi:hypothetical protein